MTVKTQCYFSWTFILKIMKSTDNMNKHSRENDSSWYEILVGNSSWWNGTDDCKNVVSLSQVAKI